MDRPAAILRPGGLVAIVDLIQSIARGCGLLRGGPAHYEPQDQRPHRTPGTGSRRRRSDHPRCWMQTFVSSASGSADSDGDQTYSGSDYRNLMFDSATQMMEESDRVGLLDEVETFIRSDFGGVVTGRSWSPSRPPLGRPEPVTCSLSATRGVRCSIRSRKDESTSGRPSTRSEPVSRRCHSARYRSSARPRTLVRGAVVLPLPPRATRRPFGPDRHEPLCRSVGAGYSDGGRLLGGAQPPHEAGHDELVLACPRRRRA